MQNMKCPTIRRSPAIVLLLHILVLAVASISTAAAATVQPFIMVIKTDNPGASASNQFALGMSGFDTFNCTVDWGDGTSDIIIAPPGPVHTYALAGTYSVSISENVVGGFGHMQAYHGDPQKILAIAQWGTGTWTSFATTFWGCSNMTITATDQATAKTGAVQDFSFAWTNCSSMVSFPVINTASGTNFSYAWSSCSGLTSFPVLNTSAGTNFSNAWATCSGLTSFPTLNTSAGTDLSAAWAWCTGLTTFPLLTTTAGTNFSQAWQQCTSLTAFPNIDTSAGTNFSNTWYQCSGLTTFPILDISAGTDISYAWSLCSALTSFPLLNTSHAINFQQTWAYCTGLTAFPHFATTTVTNFNGAWSNCSGLLSFPLLDTSNGTVFDEAWANCSGLTAFPLLTTSAGTSFWHTWNGCSGLSAFPLLNLHNMTIGIGCFGGDTLATADYSALLVDLGAHNLNVGVTFDGGFSGYSLGAPSLARNSTLIAGRGWTITDGGPVSSTPAMVLDIKTDNPGSSSSTQFTLPLHAGETYNFTIAWGDGATQTVTNSASPTHTYASAGAYEVGITENVTGGCPHLFFNNTGDRLKALRLMHWGTGTWHRFDGAFAGCSNLTILALDQATALTGGATTFKAAFANCRALTSFPFIDTSGATDFNSAWSGCTGLTTFPLLVTSAGTDFSSAWAGCNSLISFPAMDLSGMTAGVGCMTGVTFSTDSYSALLVDLANRNTHTGVHFDGGYCTYATGAPTAARNTTLIAERGWTITDGGPSKWQSATTAPAGIGTMLLLTDGTVMAAGNGDNNWYRLTPDATGSYVHGSWSTLAPMHDTRLYFASTVLLDGRVFVGGGEYGSGTSSVEVYDPLANSWTVITSWNGGDIGDSTAVTLDDGRVLLFPRFSTGGTIWDPVNDTWTDTATKLYVGNNDEEGVVRLPDGSFIIPSVPNKPLSQRYFPQSDQWLDAGSIPLQLVDSMSELGAGLRLYDGRVMFIGATGNTDFYTPGSPGSWAGGSPLPDRSQADDAPAAMLPSGSILLMGDQGHGFSAPTRMYEYDPGGNSYATVAAPSEFDNGNSSYVGRMLVLPTGQILFSNGNVTVSAYAPAGSPSSTWQPTITAIVGGSSAPARLTGTQLNGLGDGAAYGDDAQMASNYPIVRLDDGAGTIRYARTSNFSTRAIATGSTPVGADISLAGIPDGTYTLTAVANGIPSAGVAVKVTATVLRTVPTVTWATPAAITYGTLLSATQLDAVASVPGTFAYTPVLGTILGSGSNTLMTVFTPTDAVHNSTASASVALTVNQVSLLVTANAGSRLFGAANPTFTGTLTGVVAGDTITATYASSATLTTPVGSYGPATAQTITPTLHDPGVRLANYVVTTTKGTLTIIRAALTITAVDASMVSGQPVPTLTATAVGLVPPGTLASLDVPPTITTTATSASPAGTYPIVVASASDHDYTITMVNGTLTVTATSGQGGGGGGGGKCGLGSGIAAMLLAMCVALISLRARRHGEDLE